MFGQAETLVQQVWQTTQSFLVEGRFGLRESLPRVVSSAPTNLVGRRVRATKLDDANLSGIALGSVPEVRYHLGLANRHGLLAGTEKLVADHSTLFCGLQALVASLEDEPEDPRPSDPARHR